MVLGTDMKQHVTIISRFQTSLQVKLHSRMMTTAGCSSSATAESLAVKFEDPADRSMLLQANLLTFLCLFLRQCLTAMILACVCPSRDVACGAENVILTTIGAKSWLRSLCLSVRLVGAFASLFTMCVPLWGCAVLTTCAFSARPCHICTHAQTPQHLCFRCWWHLLDCCCIAGVGWLQSGPDSCAYQHGKMHTTFSTACHPIETAHGEFEDNRQSIKKQGKYVKATL